MVQKWLQTAPLVLEGITALSWALYLLNHVVLATSQTCFLFVKPRFSCLQGGYTELQAACCSQDQGSASCSPCLVGHYCAGEHTSWEVMLLAMVCPAGLLCPQGQAVVPDTTANACPRGYYCPQGDAGKPCPNGTYGEQMGLSSVAECLPCPMGKYCYRDGIEPPGIPYPTGDCPPGYHCPPGTGFPFSFPCMPGFFWDNSSTEGEDPCTPCPPGYYCDSPAMPEPKACPAGFYCVEGSSKPEPCPEGTYSSKKWLSGPSKCRPCASGLYCAAPGQTGPSGPWTYSNLSGLRSLQECLDCPPGDNVEVAEEASA
ncbi:uncharacterized protein ACIB01_017296 [Guaruba guarouba]